MVHRDKAGWVGCAVLAAPACAGMTVSRGSALSLASARSEAPTLTPPRPRRARRAGWLRPLTACLVLALAACAEPTPPTLTVRALYVGPQYEGQAAIVEHEEIPGAMEAMRMTLRVDAPGAFDDVEPGRPVRLTLDSASLAIVGVETLPADTRLDL